MARRVLVIENNQKDRREIRKNLEKNNYEVFEAGNEKEGIQQFLENPPDAILVRLIMEHMDSGIEISEELKMLNNKAPVFLMSRVANEMAGEVDYLKLGFSALLQKPIDTDKLIRLLNLKLNTPSGEKREEIPKKVLVIENNLEDRQKIKRSLEANSFEVIEAQDEKEGIKKYIENTPDAILVRLMMEHINAGIEIAEVLKMLDNKAPVFLMSQVANEMAGEVDYLKLGFGALLQKPIDTDRLIKLLKHKLN